MLDEVKKKLKSKMSKPYRKVTLIIGKDSKVTKVTETITPEEFFLQEGPILNPEDPEGDEGKWQY